METQKVTIDRHRLSITGKILDFFFCYNYLFPYCFSIILSAGTRHVHRFAVWMHFKEDYWNMEIMNVSKKSSIRHTPRNFPAYFSLLPLVLSYCPTYFIISRLVFRSCSTFCQHGFSSVFPNLFHYCKHWLSTVLPPVSSEQFQKAFYSIMHFWGWFCDNYFLTVLVFSIINFSQKWSSRMTNLQRKVHTFVDRVHQPKNIVVHTYAGCCQLKSHQFGWRTCICIFWRPQKNWVWSMTWPTGGPPKINYGTNIIVEKPA